MNALNRLEVIREETNSLFIEIYKEIDTNDFNQLNSFLIEIGSNINSDTLSILGINLIKLSELIDNRNSYEYSAWIDEYFTYIPEMDEVNPEYISYRDLRLSNIA